MPTLDKTTYNQYISSQSSASSLIIHITITADFSPEQALAALTQSQPQLALLDFDTQEADNHYSFLGFKPIAQLTCKDKLIQIKKNGVGRKSYANPFILIKELQQSIKPLSFHQDVRLTASPIAAMAYDAVRYIEDLKCDPKAKSTPDIEVNFYEYGIYFNHQKNVITLSRYIESPDYTEADYDQAIQSLMAILEQINQPQTSTQIKIQNGETFSLSIPDELFKHEVNQAKSYIKQGEVFQLVLSRAYTKQFNQNPIDLYFALKHKNPSPYHVYLQTPDYTIVAASPEKIVRVNNQNIISTPLAGTKPIEDSIEATIEKLLNDEKELAEHMMLVDLARNDIGRVSVPGTVKATKLTYPLILKNIIHIASEVQGTLDSKYQSLDALTASFPAGTLSGAPKIRAMQLIEKLETKSRGFYGGCIFAIDHHDNLDSCIIIRHAEISNHQIKVQTGSGIVFDSDPESECLETKNKAKAMLTAIQFCETGVKQ